MRDFHSDEISISRTFQNFMMKEGRVMMDEMKQDILMGKITRRGEKKTEIFCKILTVTWPVIRLV